MGLASRRQVAAGWMRGMKRSTQLYLSVFTMVMVSGFVPTMREGPLMYVVSTIGLAAFLVFSNVASDIDKVPPAGES